MPERIEPRFDTRLLIAGENLSNDIISGYIIEYFKGDRLLVIDSDDLIKIHFHTSEPWQISEYGQSIGGTHDVIVENMQRQTDSLQGQ